MESFDKLENLLDLAMISSREFLSDLQKELGQLVENKEGDLERIQQNLKELAEKTEGDLKSKIETILREDDLERIQQNSGELAKYVEQHLEKETGKFVVIYKKIRESLGNNTFYEDLNDYNNELLKLLNTQPINKSLKSCIVRDVSSIFVNYEKKPKTEPELEPKPIETDKTVAHPSDTIYGDKDKVFEEVANKYIDIKDVEAYEYPGKLVTIRLPKIGEFEGCYFQYFLTNDSFPRQQYYSLIKDNREMGKQVILFERLVELMKKIREYMKVRGVDMDKDKNFNTDLDNWDKMLERSDVGYFLKTKAGFGGDKFDNYYIRDSGLFDEPENNDNLYLRCRDGVFQVRKRNRNRVNLAVAKIILNLIN